MVGVGRMFYSTVDVRKHTGRPTDDITALGSLSCMFHVTGGWAYVSSISPIAIEIVVCASSLLDKVYSTVNPRSIQFLVSGSTTASIIKHWKPPLGYAKLLVAVFDYASFQIAKVVKFLFTITT